jgi:CRP/FNR family transcriptional regulator
MASGKPSPVVDIQSVQAVCQQCRIQALCLPFGLDKPDLERLDHIIERKRPLGEGDFVYRSGDPFHALYAVRSGLVKTAILEKSGDEHIVGFHFPGELVGLDAIADGRHACSARALDTTSLCEIPYARLDELAGRIPGLRHQLFRLMSQEIHRDEQERRSQAQASAAPRLAAFLVDVSRRFDRLGYSPDEFRLKISNQDLARFLGLAPETVSRLFRRLRDQGLVTARQKQIRIHDPRALEALARDAQRQ